MKHIKVTSVSKYPIINIDVKESNGNVYIFPTNGSKIEEFAFIVENCPTIKIKDDITFIYENIKYSLFNVSKVIVNKNFYSIFTNRFELEYLG